MNIGAVIVMLKLLGESGLTKADAPPLDYYNVGDKCPTVGKLLGPNQRCINNRIQPILK